jgi:hypothetical protein
MEVYFWQSPKSKKTHGGLQAVTAVTAGQSQAAVVSATFLSTADNSDMSNLYVDNVSLGDQVKVVIAMDNGGNALFNQTWNASDVLSVTFEFNNGAHKTVFNPNGGNGFSTDSGSFVTDGSGQLIEVPSDWTDTSNVNAISTNSTQTPNGWYLNEVNDKYFTNSDSFAVGFTDAASNTVASNWTISFDSSGAVPEPSSLAVFGIGMCVAGVRAARRRRLDPKQ